MGRPSPSIRDLARRLLALEAAGQSAADSRIHEAIRVCEKLRDSLSRFAGADGFTALLRRAVALARADVPALAVITVQPDCSLAGLEELAADAGTAAGNEDAGAEAVASITAHLIGLLEAFIGRPLTLRLLRDAWPDASFDE